MADDVDHPPAFFRYRLSVDDALAYERLPGELTGRQKLGFLLPFIAIAAVAGFLEDMPALWRWGTISALLLLWGLVWLIGRNVRQRRRATARIAREGSTEVEDRGDHLVIRNLAGEIRLGDEMVGKVIVAESRIFILYPGDVLIMPLSGFASAQEMSAFAEVIDARSMQASQ